MDIYAWQVSCGLRQFQFSVHEISPTHSPDVHVSMYAYMYHLSSRCWHVFLASRVVYYGIAYTHYISFGNSSLMLCVPQFLSFELCSIVYWLLSLKVSIPFNYICYKQVVPFRVAHNVYVYCLHCGLVISLFVRAIPDSPWLGVPVCLARQIMISMIVCVGKTW